MGSSGRMLTSTDILDGTITNADVAAGAGIDVTKLALGANKTVLAGGASVNAFTASPTLSGGLAVEGGVNVGPGVTGAAAGFLQAAGGFYPGNQATGFTCPVPSVSVGASGGTALVAPNTVIGFVLVSNISTGQSALYAIQGPANAVTLLAGSGSSFGTVASLNGLINVFPTGGSYYVYNGGASAQFVRVYLFG